MEPSPPPEGAPARRRNPWWIPPFLGRVPSGIQDSHLKLLGAVALALVFEEYDIAMLTAALKYIAADLGMREPDFGWYLGTIRLGAVPAVLLIPLIDRIGRRRTFLITLVGTGVFTVLTGFAQTAWQFVGAQMATRVFFVAGSAVAFVMVSEEYPADRRGWGIGMLAALGSCGHAVAALLFSGIESLPWGWRTLYFMGFVPLAMFPWFRARLVETERFARHEAQQAAAPDAGLLAPLRELATRFPARALGLTLTALFYATGSIAAYQLTGYFALEVHGWSPGQYAAMFIVGGGVGIIGNVIAGQLGDRVGRKRVGFLALAGFPIFVAAFYLGPAWVLPPAWAGFVFCSSAGRTVVRSFATELFPTSQRGTSTGWWSLMDALGGGIGLFLLAALSTQEGDAAAITPFLALGVAASGVVVLFFPETRARELEDISA